VAAKLSNAAKLPVSVVQGSEIVERPLRDVTQEARLDERVNPFVERTEQLWQESWDAVQESRRAVSTITDSEGKEHIRGRDLSVRAPIINAAARTLELYGRGSGFLVDQPGTPQQNTIVLVLPAAPASTVAIDDVPFEVIDVTGEK
jgi:hypothetical protein